MDPWQLALFLSVVVKAILDYIAEPLRTKYPALDLWYFNWIALIFGAGISWLAGLDVFGPYLSSAASPVLGKILTALLVGGGSKLLNDVLSNAPGRALSPLRGLKQAEADEQLRHLKPRGW